MFHSLGLIISNELQKKREGKLGRMGSEDTVGKANPRREDNFY